MTTSTFNPSAKPTKPYVTVTPGTMALFKYAPDETNNTEVVLLFGEKDAITVVNVNAQYACGDKVGNQWNDNTAIRKTHKAFEKHFQHQLFPVTGSVTLTQ